MFIPNTNQTGSTILKEWTTPDFRNTPSTTNIEEEEIVDALGNDGNASMPEQVRRSNPWRKMMVMMKNVYIASLSCSPRLCYSLNVVALVRGNSYYETHLEGETLIMRPIW
jgi:hypothetical protein